MGPLKGGRELDPIGTWGIPIFQTPVADGPVIEEANLRALNGGFKMKHLLMYLLRLHPK